MCMARVKRPDRADFVGLLALDEIVIFDKASEAIPPSKLSAVISSQPDSNSTRYAAANCIDGNTGAGYGGGPACQVAEDDENPHLDVLFPCVTGKAMDTVSRVDVYNRVDGLGSGIEYYVLQLIDAGGSTVAKTYSLEPNQDKWTLPGGRAHLFAGVESSPPPPCSPRTVQSTGAACGDF